MSAGLAAWARKRRELWALLGLVALALALRFYDLTGESLWFDEAYAVWSSSMDIASPRILWEWRIEFALFYVLLHYWMRLFGQGELAVRAFVALVGSLSIAPMYALAKGLFDRRVALASATLLAVNPYHIWYSQEVRSYALAILFSICSMVAFWRLLRGGRWPWWVGYALFSGLGFHLHYYIGWILLVQNIFYLGHVWWEHGRSHKAPWRALGAWVVAQAAIVALAFPAVVVFYTYLVERNQWIWLEARYAPPTLSNMLHLFNSYVMGMYIPGPAMLRRAALALYVGLAAWAVAHAFVRRRREPERCKPVLLLLATLAMLGLIWALAQFFTMWVLRYLLIFLPFFLVLVAAGWSAVRSAILRGVLGAACVLTGLYALSGIYHVPQKEDWRGVAAYVTANAQAEDIIILLDEDCRVPFNYYYGEGGRRVKVSRFADAAELERTVQEIIATRSGQHLWLVLSHTENMDLKDKLDQVACLARQEAPAFIGIQVVPYAWEGGAPCS